LRLFTSSWNDSGVKVTTAGFTRSCNRHDLQQWSQPSTMAVKTIIIQHFSSLINTYTNHLIGTHSSHSIVKFMLYNPVNNKHYNACIKHLIIHWHVIPFVKVNERFLGLAELFWPKSIHKLTLSCTLGVISNTGP